MDNVLAALGLEKSHVLSGFLGALVSYRFFLELEWLDRLVTVALGIPVAIYCGPLVAHAFNLSPKSELGATFIVGAVGVSFLSAVVKAMPEIVTAAKEAIFKAKK